MFRVCFIAPALLALSCSFTTASGFNECTVDTDCVAASTCIEKYCIKLPEGCTRGFGNFGIADHVRLAAVLPLTDTAGARDESQFAGLNAYAMALDEMNQRGGANGAREMALYVCDNRRNNDTAKAQAAWLAQQLKVPAIAAGGSAQALAVANATRDAGTMVMSARATSPELVDVFQTTTDGLLWRTAPPDTLQGRVLADLILNDATYTGVTKVGIIYVDDAYGGGLRRELSTRLMTGGRTVMSAPFVSGMDVTAQVNGLAAALVNATVVIGVTDDTKRILTAAFLTTQLRRTAGHKWAFADASKNRDILTVAGATTELAGSLGTAPAQGAGTAYPGFRDAYLVKFSRDPGDFSFTSHSYDAMYLLGIAASYATSGGRPLDGRTMATAMTKIASTGTAIPIEPSSFGSMYNSIAADVPINVEGNSGKLDYIPDAGAPFARIEEWRIEADGGFSTVTLIDPPTN